MTSLIKSYCLGVICLMFYGCDQLSGKIEKRQKNNFYLVNTSTEKEFRFIVKKTTVTNDKWYQYETSAIELLPGDEKYLGVEEMTEPIEYPNKEISVFKTYTLKEIADMGDGRNKVVSNKVQKNRKSSPNDDFSKAFDKAVKEANPFLLSPWETLKDTIINGEHLKWRFETETAIDSLHPKPRITHKYIYEVKGQQEIKIK